jgi:hypothetical protein
MERLIQKYAKKFDIAMIIVILIQLMDAVFVVLTKCIRCESVISVMLSVVNIILLTNSLRCNKTQQFIEWKANAKILRYTIGLFIIFHVFVCVLRGFNMLELGAHLMNLLTVETVLTYRINSIAQLEELANKYAKEREDK